MSVNTESEVKRKKTRGRHAKAKRTLLILRVVIVFLLVVAAALTGVLYLARSGQLTPPDGTGLPVGQETIRGLVQDEPVVYTASFATPLDEPIVLSVTAGDPLTLPAGPEIDGFTFLSWNDESGKPVEQSEITLEADAAFTGVYAVAFRDAKAETSHAAYLSLDGDGRFRPADPLLRSEAVTALYALLDTDMTGSAGFDDVPPAAAYHDAAAALKELGAIDGNLFRPDEPISCGEFFRILSAFFPKAGADCSFALVPSTDPLYGAFCLAMERGWIDDAETSPDWALTRRQAARIFASLSGRTGAAEEDCRKVGTILDVSLRDPDYWIIAEAVIPHEASFSDGGESWLSSEALPRREEGLFFIGTELHCADAQGSALVSESYGNFDFGESGVITTGMPELDACVQEKLQELVDPASMSGEQMLRAIYDDVTYHNSYLGARSDQLHDVGDISWVNEAAYRMFTVKKGCCYNYAAEFYVLAKAIGYDAVVYSGTINPPPIQRAHGWVEISFDGVPYIFDTELEYTQVITGHTGTVYYKISYERVAGWYYYRGE